MTTGITPTAAPAPDDRPTMEQLAIAFRNLRSPIWPDTVEEALQVKHWRVALTHAAKDVRRRATVSTYAHSLPRLPAPPTPPGHPPNKHGRSDYSLAKGPTTALGIHHQPKRFDARKAAANDLDD